MEQRWQAESSRVSRIEGGQSANEVVREYFAAFDKVNFFGSAKVTFIRV
jgi:hypothetical protein